MSQDLFELLLGTRVIFIEVEEINLISNFFELVMTHEMLVNFLHVIIF
jgi:hypothetical protein